MANRQPDAIALLKADHRTVEDLFDQYEATKSDSKKAKLVKQICMELIIHTDLEEEIFYPALRGRIENDTLDEAYVEHDGAKLLIAELLNGEVGDDFYDAKVKVLSEDIVHHVHEEEMPSEGMFAQARATDADLNALGEQMRARKEELKAKYEAEGLPTPMTRAMSGAPVERGQPVDIPA